MTQIQRVIEITSPVFLPEEDIPAGGPGAAFTVERPLALEIGCGIGDFIIQLARQHPERNHLAIDIYNKGCHKTCKKVEAAGLNNVRVMRIEARYLLTRHLGRESLAAIYINCPDPWPKKRHRGRRLVNADFLRMAHYYLRPGGDFHFSTDFADYAEDVAGIFPAAPGYRNRLAEPFALSLPGYPLSKYMRRFLDQGQPIHFIHQQREADLAVDAVQPPPVLPGFRAAWSMAGNE
ncbi:MAG TPA: tRNA (guanosine(46)-N7)-methyltransferase TrmB [Desulfuromonadales bacterium]|nr:tRNA (guanosine(46)-N7)-methyltransferase TrmB [Desulfuromonadales bacterium]